MRKHNDPIRSNSHPSVMVDASEHWTARFFYCDVEHSKRFPLLLSNRLYNALLAFYLIKCCSYYRLILHRRALHIINLHTLIFRKRLGLAFTARYPFLEIFKIGSRHFYSASILPTFFIVSKIVTLGVIGIIEA